MFRMLFVFEYLTRTEIWEVDDIAADEPNEVTCTAPDGSHYDVMRFIYDDITEADKMVEIHQRRGEENNIDTTVKYFNCI